MRIKCEVCGNLVYLQHPGKNYYRIKHYLGSIDGKLSFEYHKQSLGYITGILDSSRIQRTVDPIDPTTIAQNSTIVAPFWRIWRAGRDLYFHFMANSATNLPFFSVFDMFPMLSWTFEDILELFDNW